MHIVRVFSSGRLLPISAGRRNAPCWRNSIGILDVATGRKSLGIASSTKKRLRLRLELNVLVASELRSGDTKESTATGARL